MRTSALPFAFLCVLSILLLLPLPTSAAQTQPERTPLTLELLQERLRTPTLREGNLTVDLQKMVIDLRPENASFRDAFYQLLRKELGAKPLGLDLSYALILGDFVGSDLGLRTPLYAKAIAPIFTASEQQELERLRFVCLESLVNSKDCRSLLGTESTPAVEIAVFRGVLKLVQTRFNGEIKFSNTFFLQSVDAQGATFLQSTNWAETRFGRPISFSGGKFKQQSNFQGSIFLKKLISNKVNFRNSLIFKIVSLKILPISIKQLLKSWLNSIVCSGEKMLIFLMSALPIKYSLLKQILISFSF